MWVNEIFPLFLFLKFILKINFARFVGKPVLEVLNLCKNSSVKQRTFVG